MVPDTAASGDGEEVNADVPETVLAALADQPVEGAVCLEAGAGVGNATAGLLRAGAASVYAVTNDRDHARTVRKRVSGGSDRLAVLEADLRVLPLASDAADVITAHGLFAGYGWTFERERTLLDPVPWTDSHLEAHAAAAREAAADVTGAAAAPLESLIDSVEDGVEDGVEPASVGEMYSIAMCLPG